MPIAAGPAILGAAAIGGVASIASGAFGANAANQAASTQADSAVQAAQIQADSSNRAIDIENQQYQQSRADSLPWLEAGQKALDQYQGELGLTKTNADGTPFTSQFQETPGYQYDVSQAEKGVTNNLAALGLKGSGAALKALTKTRMGLADTTYNNYLNRVASVAGQGQTQANSDASTGSNYAANVGNTLVGAGNNAASGILGAGAARASGYINSTNALTGALGNVANIGSNALGYLSGNNGWA